ncbi:hypothetical protein CRG98_042315 [Punica granatum]|uniref:G-patch domain-containing protein n=1 Tax=Punica granatum TaxID=22663 RepID=A0A2I0HZZ7_PUNGR|nr:hypothetical protein CRG98_042315 [Punica granatum]
MDRPAPGLRLEAITPPTQDIMRIWRNLRSVDHAFIQGIIGDVVMLTETSVDWIFLRTAAELWDLEHAVFNFQGTELAPTIEEYTALIQRPTSTIHGIFVPNPFTTVQGQLSTLVHIPAQDIHEELHERWSQLASHRYPTRQRLRMAEGDLVDVSEEVNPSVPTLSQPPQAHAPPPLTPAGVLPAYSAALPTHLPPPASSGGPQPPVSPTSAATNDQARIAALEGTVNQMATNMAELLTLLRGPNRASSSSSPPPGQGPTTEPTPWIPPTRAPEDTEAPPPPTLHASMAHPVIGPYPPPPAPTAERRLKRMEETIRALQAGDARPDARYGDCSLFPAMRLPPKFKIPEFKAYEGTTDPRHHLRHYWGKMLQYWEYEEFAEDIPTWEDLSRKFIDQYRYCAEAPPTLLELSTKEMARGQKFEDEAQQIQLFHSTLRGVYYSHLLAHTSSFSDLIEAGKKLDLGIKLGRMEDPTSKRDESSKKVPATSSSSSERRGKEVTVKTVNTAQQAPQQYSMNYTAAPPTAPSYARRHLNIGLKPLPNQSTIPHYRIHPHLRCRRLSSTITPLLRPKPLNTNLQFLGLLSRHNESRPRKVNKAGEGEQGGSSPFVIEYIPTEAAVGFTGIDAPPAPLVIDIPAREPYSDDKVPWTYEGDKVKFIVEDKIITVKGEEDYAIYKETAVPYISVGDDENLPFHSFETVSVIRDYGKIGPSRVDRMIGKVLLRHNYIPGTGLGARGQGINRPIEVEEYKHRRGLGFRPSCHEIIEARRSNRLHRLATHYGRLNRGIPVPPLSHFFPGPPLIIGSTSDGPSSDFDDTTTLCQPCMPSPRRFLQGFTSARRRKTRSLATGPQSCAIRL